jgi:hypothetical protein
VDSLKLEHTLDWLHVTSGQIWSFKIAVDASNRLRACSDYHSVLKDENYDQLEQDMNDFFEESSVTHWRDTSVYKTKMEVIWWYFHIEHIINHVISVKKDAKQENEVTIMSKMKSLSLVQTEGPIGDC